MFSQFIPFRHISKMKPVFCAAGKAEEDAELKILVLIPLVESRSSDPVSMDQRSGAGSLQRALPGRERERSSGVVRVDPKAKRRRPARYPIAEGNETDRLVSAA